MNGDGGGFEGLLMALTMAPAAVEFSSASSNAGLVGLMIENIIKKTPSEW